MIPLQIGAWNTGILQESRVNLYTVDAVERTIVDV